MQIRNLGDCAGHGLDMTRAPEKAMRVFMKMLIGDASLRCKAGVEHAGQYFHISHVAFLMALLGMAMAIGDAVP